VLAEGRRLLEAGDLEGANKCAYRAETLHGPYSIMAAKAQARSAGPQDSNDVGSLRGSPASQWRRDCGGRTGGVDVDTARSLLIGELCLGRGVVWTPPALTIYTMPRAGLAPLRWRSGRRPRRATQPGTTACKLRDGGPCAAGSTLWQSPSP
jgi:hypothetical protein